MKNDMKKQGTWDVTHVQEALEMKKENSGRWKEALEVNKENNERWK